MLGRANVNQNRPAIEGIDPVARFGTQNSTTNDTENSGTLQYVRIEFAGIELTPNNETNSLTMGGIGNGTTLSHVQVSYGGDDGFEWFGGTVNAKYLVSYAMWDDDFDVDFGYTGNVQFGTAIRNPSFADQSGSNGFEVDNDATGTAAMPLTAAVFSNMTVLGPGSTPEPAQMPIIRMPCTSAGMLLFRFSTQSLPASLLVCGWMEPIPCPIILRVPVCWRIIP
jgi:hypothetical protein